MAGLDGHSLMELEHPFIKVPFENLSKCFRLGQKALEKELTQVVGAVAQLKNKPQISQEEAVKSLEGLVGRLQGLKRKLEEIRKEEDQELYKCKARLDNMKLIDSKRPEEQSIKKWHKIRLDRFLVDYMLREGYFETAIQLADETNIKELVDIEIFVEARKVVDGLQRQTCTEALAWCAENRSKLRRLKSNFEFNLRLQEYIQLVKENNPSKAILYARKNFPPFSTTNMEEIQEAMALVAFKHTHHKYKKYFEESRWKNLMEEFKSDNYHLHSLTTESLLVINLQAGLSALKTTLCSDPATQNVNCPACSNGLHQLAKDLPCSHHIQSTLVCHITGEIMDTDNPPMVLPNGYVYSKKAMVEQAIHNNGKIICPRTGEVFEFEELRKAFIL